MTEPKWWVRDLFEETAKIAYALCRGNNLTAAYADQPEPLQTCADLLNDYQQRISDLEARAVRLQVGLDSILYWVDAIHDLGETRLDYPVEQIKRIANELVGEPRWYDDGQPANDVAERIDAIAESLPSTTKETQ